MLYTIIPTFDVKYTAVNGYRRKRARPPPDDKGQGSAAGQALNLHLIIMSHDDHEP